MFVLHIEAAVVTFDGWKTFFESRPHDRTQTGAHRYRILRPIDHPNDAIVEVEFATVREAEAALSGLRETWSRMQGTIYTENPKARIAEVVQSVEL